MFQIIRTLDNIKAIYLLTSLSIALFWSIDDEILHSVLKLKTNILNIDSEESPTIVKFVVYKRKVSKLRSRIELKRTLT